MNNILIINPFGIGDVLFTTPVIRNLRLAYPQARIAFLANRRTSEFLHYHPDIHKVFVYERDEFVAIYGRNPLAFAQKWAHLLGEIRLQKFDAVFDFSLNSTFGFLSMSCGIPRRIGFDYRGRGRFLTDKFPLAGYEGKHVIEHYLDLLSHVGVPIVEKHMTIHIQPQNVQWVKDWFKAQDVDTRKPLVAMVPGGGQSWGVAAKFKRWPAAQYAALADKIIEKYDCAIILLGDKNEEPLSREVARLAGSPLYSAVGETSILQMAALMQECRLSIVNDGGPLHIAVACGAKTLSIFGPVDPVVYGPYPAGGHKVVQKGLPCQPCYRRFRMAQCEHVNCLNHLSVDEVYRKVEHLL